MARQERLPFPHSTHTSTRIFQLLHIDLWGPYHMVTHDNYRYFITLVDDYSRCTWTQLLTCKSNTLEVIKNFLSMIQTQFNTCVQTIRTDNGLEFVNTETTAFLKNKGIIHEKTCPYTPQQNGVVERKHKYLLETARALLFQSKLPLKYWGECVLCATYIINRLPTSHMKGKCPYELLYNTKPVYSHMRTFGCLCYPTLPKPHRDKFQARTTPHIFLGYPFGSKGYKVLSLATKKIHISRDVVFKESIFPFNVLPDVSSFPSVLHSVPFIDIVHPNIESQLVQHVENTVIDASDTLPHTSPNHVTDSPTTIHSSNPEPTVSCRPSRPHKLPTYLHDYVLPRPMTKPLQNSNISLNSVFSKHQHIPPEVLALESQSLVRNVSNDDEPSSYGEAAMNPAWQHAMTQEFEALHTNHTWDLVNLPNGKKAIGCRWVYKVKPKADGTIERFKARLVVKGYTQEAGVDYTETFSPVIKMTTVRALLATAVKKGWNIFQLDVNNAFLHGDLHEEVYMEVPPGLVVHKPGMVCKLNKSLYGLKQASRQWYAKLTEALYSKGYTHSLNDYSLFHKKSENSSIFVAVYVDDVILTGTSDSEIEELKIFLHDKFKIKDLGRLHYFLGMEVLYKEDGLIISQRKFVLDLLKDYKVASMSSCNSPLDPAVKLHAKEGAPLSEPLFYRKLVGKLNFLTNTRMDISYSVQHLSQFMQDPREPHLQAAFHILRYLKADPTLGIFMSQDQSYNVKAYCDSDWAACPDTRKSVSGYIVLLGNSPLSWKSKKQETISLSSAEAEYRALRKVAGELVWLSRLLTELTLQLPMPIEVYCDSQSALHIARNPVFHERTKHIEVDCHFVRNLLQSGLISLHHISSDNQLADILTKTLTGFKHSTALSKLSVFSTPST
uniref:Integrase catalytic domain-containing protein n=1 Tax=Solanum tuberosum TaxID=4113 RepID=M1ANG9_SOLTU